MEKSPRSRRPSSVSRSRWAAIGAAVAVTLGAGGLVAVDAAGTESSFVAIEPTRVLDTRIDAGLDGPFGSATPRTLDVTGTVEVVLPGDTVGSGSPVPDGATSIVANVTVTQATTGGFVSLRPGTATGTPTTSTVNFDAGQTVANAATVQLPPTGLVQLFYQGQTPGSTAEIIVDIVGYHVEGTAGPQGDDGPIGPQGERGLSAWEIVPSGQTLIGEFAYDGHAAGPAGSDQILIAFPAIAPEALFSSDVNFQADAFADTDPSCVGSSANPTAPAGQVCIYWSLRSNDVNAAGTQGASASLSTRGFRIIVAESAGATAGDDLTLRGTWAYTAP